jgi:phosphatidylinositol alpha-1,6-mannosyltransferase
MRVQNACARALELEEDRVRVLMVASNFPPVIGGIQTYAFELARGLVRRSSELLVVAPKSEGAREFDATSGVPTLRMASIGDDLALSGVLPLVLLLRRRKFDVAFATHWAPGFAVQEAARVGGIDLPVFIAAHGKELLHRPLAAMPFAQSVYDRARNVALQRAQGFFPVSQRTAQLLAATVARSNVDICVVSNGVDPTQFQPSDASGLRADLTGPNAGGPMLLSVARLVTRKGLDTALHAFSEVLKEHPSATYVILGDGPDYGRLARLASELGVTRNVCFIARSTRPLADYYNACDVFVMPAREEPGDIEGFGLVFLEAGACGKPVIGARAGGVTDAIVDGVTGLLVPPDDPEALTRAINGLLGDPEWCAALGRAARTRILRECTWDHAADRIAERLAGATM